MDYEKLGVFYLGKEYDLASAKLQEELVLYDSRDLTTHAVCVGMTGSGKTGLCIDLLEEAAIDGVPALIIDPKGDITNLLLTFPQLRPEDFLPWISPDDARRKGLSEEQYAAAQADLWRGGLAQWGESPERIQRLRKAVDFAVYTPGSEFGIPVSILQSFSAPRLDWEEEGEALREEVQSTVSALLGLVGVEADPLRSREHILLANLFEYFWRKGEDLDLQKLILSIQEPPLRQLEVLDVDTFFPKKDRFQLAMLLNNLIASPTFASWMTGQPLEIPGFLATPQGKPRHSIFYIAHLSEAERMFFVTLLLNRVIAWMRGQPGTTSPRALFYMDEIFGFFPPVANPPSKLPMLTLLKQARAYGVGVVLTTQNPVDLDYKGPSNAGTWFVGRLQAERDKERLLDGLVGASAAAGRSLDATELGTRIAGLANRVFLLHNVNKDTPLLFQTRWALSYLRGPLTRPQVRLLMGDRQPDGVDAAPTGAGEGITGSARSPSFSEASALPPVSPSGLQQGFLEVRLTPDQAQAIPGREEAPPSLLYQPALFGVAKIHYKDSKRGLDQWQERTLLLSLSGDEGTAGWERALQLNSSPRLTEGPQANAHFAAIPASANELKELTALSKDLEEHLYRTCRFSLLAAPTLKLVQAVQESERDFRLRLGQTAREERDREGDKLREKYRKKLESLQDKLARARAEVAQHQSEASARSQEVWVSAGESLLGAFLGRRSSKAASSAMSKARQSSKAAVSIQEAREKLQRLELEMAQLSQEMERELVALATRWNQATVSVETLSVAPIKSDFQIAPLVLVWAPYWQWERSRSLAAW
ncbi:MAG: type IV secretion system DNA-binding domain-containing protein [Coprothermobacterota bacterium]|nr:type IV secretion system DNA-binding domain-containing protein [Coprothermobacterota bacterium]